MSPQPDSAATPRPASSDRRVGSRTASPVDVGLARVGRSADVVLARLIADEASFARRVRRSRESVGDHRIAPTPASLLADVDADRLA